MHCGGKALLRTPVRTRVMRASAGVAFLAATAIGCASDTADASSTTTAAVESVSANDPFLDTVQARTFHWFWDNTDPRTGLTPDRWPSRTFSSVAAIGFGLSSYIVGAERGFVTRAQAAERTRATLEYLWRLPQGSAASGVAGYQGFYYHFLQFDTGLRFEHVELSSIDTGILLIGALSCQQYFNGSSGDEVAIRAYADSLYRRANWKWFASNKPPGLSMGWHPESNTSQGNEFAGFNPYNWVGYDEAMLLYVLALGSPTFPIDSTAWNAWTSGYQWRDYYGKEHVNFAPLFGHQYSHVWIDFRGIRDAYMRGRGMDYFENSRRATYAQRAYAIDNPNQWTDYGPNIWGLSAADGAKDTTVDVGGRTRNFFTYRARGAAATKVEDDGTLAPTAVGGSMPFAPEIALSALKEMRRKYGSDLFGQYGFFDAFNPTYRFGGRLPAGRIVQNVGWFDTDYLGIDQGPILLMIENYRTGLLWKLMRGSPYIRRGLERAGFSGGWLATP